MSGSSRPIPMVFLAALLAVLGCAGRPKSRVVLPLPVESTTIGAGDVFVLTIVGEDKLPKEFRVSPDGSVDFAYIHRQQVAGLEPQEIVDLVRKKLMEADILRDPSVAIDVKEYNSKRVVVLGQVQKPGSFPLTPGFTLIQAISQAGGFNTIANRDRVNLTRRTAGQTRTIVLSVDAITDGTLPDIPLQSGDTIFVGERIF
ncbi:MAG TPA: polysaccharide biosynthesis/export family protein [Polyangiaceae bacterium]|nr:polysaccharide biosynthesis/export family protein [Polyangiaceae bacterium]